MVGTDTEQPWKRPASVGAKGITATTYYRWERELLSAAEVVPYQGYHKLHGTIRVDGSQADENLFFKQQNSGECMENGKSFTASIQAAILGGDGAEAALILALYDSQMRMVDCVSVERKVAAGKIETLSATLSC